MPRWLVIVKFYNPELEYELRGRVLNAVLAFGREVITIPFVADFCPQDKNPPRKGIDSLPAELPEVPPERVEGPEEGQA